MEWGFQTVESWVFITVETAILVAVLWEGWISLKHYKHAVHKRQKRKAQNLIRKLLRR